MAEIAAAAAIADLVARSVALAAAALAGVVALTHWAVRSRRIPPMGAWSRTVRTLSDPLLKPIERRLLRRGGNPQDGSLWLLGITVILGLILMSGVRWLFEVIYELTSLAQASAKTWAMVATSWVFTILTVALFVRVLSSWLGVSPDSRWMRPFVWLTDWFVAPLRRIVPPIGMFDVSPLVAYLLLLVVRAVVFRLIFQV